MGKRSINWSGNPDLLDQVLLAIEFITDQKRSTLD